jgi:hypothetical protein
LGKNDLDLGSPAILPPDAKTARSKYRRRSTHYNYNVVVMDTDVKISG